MPTIRQRESGHWQAVVRRKGYSPELRTFARKADAELWARQVEGEMDRGVYVSRREAETTTLKDALERYEREITSKKRGAEQEKYVIRALLSEGIAKRTLAGVRGEDVARFRDAELARGLAASSVMKRLALLSHLFEIAVKEWGIECLNPVTEHDPAS